MRLTFFPFFYLLPSSLSPPTSFFFSCIPCAAMFFPVAPHHLSYSLHLCLVFLHTSDPLCFLYPSICLSTYLSIYLRQSVIIYRYQCAPTPFYPPHFSLSISLSLSLSLSLSVSFTVSIPIPLPCLLLLQSF